MTSSAAELLRGLYAEGRTNTTFLHTPAVARVPLPLLPLLAGLVKACEGLSEPGTLGIYAACVRVNEALAALNAAAAKEVR